jgi:hypothetical protein
MKCSHALSAPLLFALALCIWGGDFFRHVGEFHNYPLASQNLPGESAKDVFCLFAEQEIPFSRINLKGRNDLLRFWRMVFFTFLILPLLAARSRAVIGICKLFRFYTRAFFDYLVKALLLGGQAPPSYSFT